MKSGYLSEVFVSFQGEGAHVGERHLFVRLAGCNIRCSYCDTPDSLERTSGFMIFGPGAEEEFRLNPVESLDLRSLITSTLLTRGPIDAIALTGGEPLVQSGFLADVCREPFAVPVLLETNGMLPQRLAEVLPMIDIVSMDIKLPSNAGERPFWEEHAAFVELACTKELYAKILVDESTSLDDLQQAAAVLVRGGQRVTAFMQPINDASGRPRITPERLESLFCHLRRHHSNLRVLPQTHKMMGLR